MTIGYALLVNDTFAMTQLPLFTDWLSCRQYSVNSFAAVFLSFLDSCELSQNVSYLDHKISHCLSQNGTCAVNDIDIYLIVQMRNQIIVLLSYV